MNQMDEINGFTRKTTSVFDKKLQNRTGKLGFGSNLLKNKDREPPRNPFSQFLCNWENGCTVLPYTEEHLCDTLLSC